MIYLIRHGQTDKNKEKRLQGRSNTPLNEVGIAEAKAVGEWFRSQGITFDRCYSSPLDRAVQTAELVSGAADPANTNAAPEIQRDDRLLEMDYGPYEGVSLEQPPAEIIEFFSDFVNNPAPEGMEPLDHVVARLGEFIEDVVGQVAGAGHADDERNTEQAGAPRKAGAVDENILISLHAISMKGALEYLTPESGGDYWSKYIGNCSVYAFDRSDDGLTVPEELEILQR